MLYMKLRLRNERKSQRCDMSPCMMSCVIVIRKVIMKHDEKKEHTYRRYQTHLS